MLLTQFMVIVLVDVSLLFVSVIVINQMVRVVLAFLGVTFNPSVLVVVVCAYCCSSSRLNPLNLLTERETDTEGGN